MSDDFRVKPRSDSEIRAIARKVRKLMGIENEEHVDILECVMRDTIPTVIGVQRLELQTVSDNLMKGDNGRTSFDGTVVKIEIARKIRHGAFVGDGYSRNTIGHELGHAVLHPEHMINGVAMARRSLSVVTPGWIKPFESAEHQAKVFAPAFLINDSIAHGLTAEEISVTFGISLVSAQIYIEQRDATDTRDVAAQRIKRSADEFRASVVSNLKPKASVNFINDCCATCGRQTIFPVGHKFMCQTCDTIYDRYQDGDQVD